MINSEIFSTCVTVGAIFFGPPLIWLKEKVGNFILTPIIPTKNSNTIISDNYGQNSYNKNPLEDKEDGYVLIGEIDN